MNRIFQSLVVTSLALSSARAEDGMAFFESKVLPVLQQRCYECHSHEKKIKGGLALDLKTGWQTGGDNGPAIIPGDLVKSHLIQAVRYADPETEMPPKGKLAASEIEVLEKWVAMGAPDSRVAKVSAKAKTIDFEAGKKFWAFQPVRDAKAPAVKDTAWPLDAVDRFILAKLEAAGLQPAADADAYTWLRRVSLDLTGLPPTPEAIESFTSDLSDQSDSSDARAVVVDRLLQSKAFGERWARHWLDLTGYADQIGTSNNVFAEHAWRYRDYVINAFNNDKPFDQFIREQVAGDLLPADSPLKRAENITATGFLVLGDVEIVAVDKLKMEMDLVDQQVSKVGTAFLGMTLGCVRCHDHKFDPIAQTDYYAIAGMFRSTDSTYKTDNGVWSSVYKTELPETTEQKAQREQLLAANAAKIKALAAEREAAEKEKVALEPQIAKATKEAKPDLEKKRDALVARIKAINGEVEHAKFFAPIVPKAFAVHDREKPADMQVTIRGNPYALGDSVKRGVMRVASWGEMPPIPPNQSGRVQLADWLADSRNPLTARVTVNRIWQKLFGEGLVRSVDYFGVRGETPTHPELLDHLATRFVNGGWSQKQIIRAIVLSRAYRMSSAHNAVAMSKDPENRLLWRMNRQRLDAEAIRDSMLAISSKLARSAGGTALPLEFPENVSSLSPKAVNPPAFNLKKMRPIQDFERTIYLPVIRTAAQPGSAKLRDVFDFTQPAQIAGKRAETAVPTQALFLLNSDMLRTRATELANDLTRTETNTGARLETLWLRALGRPITSAERDDAVQFLETAPAKAAWIELSHALLSSNEFLLRL
ncbi:PSD1 and planctomycete cytochrome C domain-containing protein [Prosthecobacter sp.]|uniref:PSD1 and planctomycete cytochrome C domain-containing protein n=1 Tax=Prosthecobacter sp. TaxID=1965333 RepID=UPI002ABB7CB6|nr:PSD1 and planctomycete cytochrome C domain-containing protein [Prosthecobacter sp.]MDZ4406004.1 PSD1 and planctomycete cytochrome C domain-containing protein [Prosthecobacter sp.]